MILLTIDHYLQKILVDRWIPKWKSSWATSNTNAKPQSQNLLGPIMS
jgi:hypothetical protein